MKTTSMYNAELMSLDRISTLPEPILESILCWLPTKEAARTCLLSREWRYKWTTIPKLMFDVCKRTSERTSDIASVEMHELHQVVLLHQGPIHDLDLSMERYTQHYDYFEFDQIMLHLLRYHTVKTLRLHGPEKVLYKLPISALSLHHLTELSLWDFDLDHPPIFDGFGKLERLSLSDVKISRETLLHLLSNSPSLKHLSLCIVESDDKCTVSELFKCLPLIEDLYMTTEGEDYDSGFQWLVLDSVPQELPTSLIHLKYFNLEGYFYDDSCLLAFLLVLIRCSPNLEKIDLGIDWDLSGYMEHPIVKEYYRDVWLEHLVAIDIRYSSCSQTEFVKFILARSPKLKNVGINCEFYRKRESKKLKTLLRAPRASPALSIEIFIASTMKTTSYLLDDVC